MRSRYETIQNTHLRMFVSANVDTHVLRGSAYIGLVTTRPPMLQSRYLSEGKCTREDIRKKKREEECVCVFVPFPSLYFFFFLCVIWPGPKREEYKKEKKRLEYFYLFFFFFPLFCFVFFFFKVRSRCSCFGTGVCIAGIISKCVHACGCVPCVCQPVYLWYCRLCPV